MAGLKSYRFILTALMVLAIPALAAAQSSVFVQPFDRTGLPGTTTITQIDPLNPTQTITATVPTGAFKNPCTLENVDVTGSTTITTLSTVDKFGVTKVDISVLTKGTGQGWTGSDHAVRIISGAVYSFNDSQSFSFKLPLIGQEFVSDFSDKISMKGAKSIDNWTIRANFRVRVDSTGAVKVARISETGDVCKG
jgi:hypothetical protein